LHAHPGHTPAFFIAEKGVLIMLRREERVESPRHDEMDDKREEAAKAGETQEPRSPANKQANESDEYRRQPYFI